MISVDEALLMIDENVFSPRVEKRFIEDAQGLVLAKDIFAPINLPPFDNSAVDGFAVRAPTLQENNEHNSFTIAAYMRAESQGQTFIKHNEAAKIMTGAPMPLGADAVVMKENVAIKKQKAYINVPIRPKDNVRFLGEDIKKASLVACKGEILTPQLMGVLLALGIFEAYVFAMPSLKIISTGDELVDPGQPLLHGQVYYFVGPMLRAQARSLGVNDVKYTRVKDDQSAIESEIANGRNADILLITGGMSKGDYDFVRPALKSSGVEQIFYRGTWRPGKPLYFGKKEGQLIFGLPGNPVACFVGFHIFVKRLIYASMKAFDALKPKVGILKKDFHKKPGLTIFARAKVNENNDLSLLEGQGSHQIFHLSKASALCLMPEQRAIVKANELVKYYPI